MAEAIMQEVPRQVSYGYRYIQKLVLYRLNNVFPDVRLWSARKGRQYSYEAN